MLTHLQIQNFKGWEDTGELRIAPITVFFGPNSSGKSSIQQFLLLLKQTAESADRTRPLHTGDEGTPVDVGSFRDLIYRHEFERTLSLRIGWDQPRSLEVTDARDRSVSFEGHRLEFGAQITQKDASSGALSVQELAYRLGSNEQTWPFEVRMRVHPRRPTRYDLQFENFNAVRTTGRAWELPAPTRFYGFPDEALAYFQNTHFLPDFSLALERMLGSISYLGPLRENPQRVYTWAGGTPPDVGWRGERTVEALLAGRDRMYNPGYKKRLRPLQVIVAEQLQALGLIHSFKVAAIAERRPEREVRVRVTRAAEDVLLTDVGFGVSQVLPVVVQAFYSPRDSTLVLEQPELHLHPSAQMRLADFFVTASRTREAGEERRVQFIIESHSEHFLRRLQRRIAEGQVEPEEVALYFCEVRGGKSVAEPLDVDLFGNIKNWPEDFFGNPMEDIAGQAEAQIRRRMQASGSTTRP